MNKKDLKNATGISATSIIKLGKCDNITKDILLNINEALGYRIEDMTIEA